MRQSCLMFFTIISKQQSCKKLYYSDFGIFKIIFWNICIVKCEKNCWYIWWIFQSSRVVKNNIIFTWEYFLLIFWNIYIVKSEKKNCKNLLIFFVFIFKQLSCKEGFHITLYTKCEIRSQNLKLQAINSHNYSFNNIYSTKCAVNKSSLECNVRFSLRQYQWQ